MFFFLWKERWIPKALRKAAAKSKQDKKGKGKLQEEVTGFGFQGVALEGGGIGSTGSAKIAGFKIPDAPAPVETKKEEPSTVENEVKSKCGKHGVERYDNIYKKWLCSCIDGFTGKYCDICNGIIDKVNA